MYDIDIAIIGSGFGGLGAAIRLRQKGFTDFLGFEKAGEIGGTWRDNTYPGCACDVPSHLYSFSFAPNPRRSDTFSGQKEIWGYLRDCTERFGIRPHLRLGHEVHVAAWNDDVLSNDFWPSVAKDNVELITAGIAEVRPHGIVAGDGVEHRADTIILGTGFHVTDSPVMHNVRGRGGRTLAEVWTPTMRAHLGTTVVGFPNLFVLFGPNTGLGHTSVVLMMESQLKQILKALEHMRRNAIVAIEPTEQAQLRHTERVDRKMAGTVWSTGGCKSWYLDSTGRNSTLWPGFATTFRLRLNRFRPDDYVTMGAGT